MKPDKRHILSRLISRLDRLSPGDPLPRVENGREPGTGLRIGITGPLGAGKSTLIDHLTRTYRHRGFTVGIIAVDPTSPFTGGALLGDRVRMGSLALDEGVFIRSLATRGSSGGLAAVAIDAADLLDAAGFDRIIIETVGVGQSEVAIAGACDITVVVLEPGGGDAIQALKAGLMEIADLFVVNKKDMRGTDRFILNLATVLEMRSDETRPDIIATSAHDGEGIEELCDWLEKHHRANQDNGKLEKRRIGQRAERIRRAAEEIVRTELWKIVSDKDLRRIIKGEQPVREAARELVRVYFEAGFKQGRAADA